MNTRGTSATSDFIFSFCSGMSLPYSSYRDEALEQILSYKKNNLKAAEMTIKAITVYQSDISISMKLEILDQLVNELTSFLLNGLFGIGFWGISVENGKPIRVDSMGVNISKKYDSVYSDMTEDEYNALDRTESMVIDQEEARKFNKYILWYKSKIAETLVPQINIVNPDGNPLISECMEIDSMLRNALRVVSPLDTSQAFSLNASAFYDSLERIGREFASYELGSGVVSPPRYSTDELDPTLPTSSFPLISEYKQNLS